MLCVRVADEGEKQTLIEADPIKFFTTDHYNGYAMVLIRLPEIDVDELGELLTEAWRTTAPPDLARDFDTEDHR